MPRAEIASKQAMHTLRQLHAELAGKLLDTKSEARRLTVCMMQVEAVMKMLQPGFDVRPIAVRRRKVNPWFKKGTMFRYVLDALRTAGEPLTAREIASHMVGAKGVSDPDRKALRELVGAVQRAMVKRDGDDVVAVRGGPAVRWSLAR
jgi:hypothetical protein